MMVDRHNDDDVERQTAAVHRRDVGKMIRYALVAAVVAAIVIVGMDNQDDVRVGYAVGDANAPIWVVLVIAAIAGIVIGWLLRHRPHHSD